MSRKISPEERKAASSAMKLIEFVDSTDRDLACFEFDYKGGNKDGKKAKVVVIIENEEVEQIED
jgi:hypothetical protein